MSDDREQANGRIDRVPYLFYCRLAARLGRGMSSNIRCRAFARVIAVSTFLLAFLSIAPAFAFDYSVELGAETGSGKDAGTLNCNFGRRCETRLEPRGLRVGIYISGRERWRANVHLHSDELGCCYFENARSSTDVDPRVSLSWVPLFEGAGRAAACSFRTSKSAPSSFASIRHARDFIINLNRSSTWRLSNEAYPL